MNKNFRIKFCKKHSFFTPHIFPGDVKLDGLRVKDTAMDFLDLPVKLKYGSLDKLVLKIPWKNLYTEPVLANIEGLNLIIVPNRGVVYNEERAKKNEYETKQKLLARLEENRKAKRSKVSKTELHGNSDNQKYLIIRGNY